MARRLNVVPRLIAAQESIDDGDTEGAVYTLADLEREIVEAIEQNAPGDHRHTWIAA